MEKRIKVTIELPNTQLWEDWNNNSEDKVLNELERDIKESLLANWVVDEVGSVKAELI